MSAPLSRLGSGLTVSLLLVLAGCGSASPRTGSSPGPGSANPPGGTLRVATGTLAAGVDPVVDLSASYLRSVGAAEGLLRLQADGSLTPELARSVEATSPTVWTVTLRPGVTFWKGGTVDAKAVAASLERSRQNPLAAGLLEGVAIAATGDLTLTLTTKEPAYNLPYALGHYQLAIHNAASYPEGTDPARAGSADLTGPYRISEFATDRRIVLTRNEKWWGGRPGLSRVEVTEVSDGQARAQLALSGQADIVQDLPLERAAEIKTAPGLDLAVKPGATTAAVYLNPASPAFSDPRVRQALAWGIDRQETVTLGTNGLSVPAPSWLSSNPAFPDATGQGYTTFDAARATRLLDDAGWALGSNGKRARNGKPFSFRLLTLAPEAKTGEVLQAQWAELGIDVAVSTVEGSLVKQSVAKGDWDAVMQSWTTLGDTPKLIAGQIGPGGAANHGKYADPRIPPLLEKASTAADEAARTEALYSLNKLIADITPLIPVHPRVAATAVSKKVTGFVLHPLQYENIVQPAMTIS